MLSFPTASAGGITSIVVIPTNFGARLTGLSDSFQLFRFTKLDLHLRLNTTSQGPVNVGYTSANLEVAATTATDISFFERSQVVWPGQTIPAVLKLSQKDLTGMIPWYRRGTAYDNTLENQGEIWVGGLANAEAAYPMFATGIIQFKDPVAPATTAFQNRPRLQEAACESDSKHLDHTRAVVSRCNLPLGSSSASWNADSGRCGPNVHEPDFDVVDMPPSSRGSSTVSRNGSVPRRP
jgi:hypothetical protein